ncbi:hypothetical protein ACWEKT_29400 [Nocardia takedensis]
MPDPATLDPLDVRELVALDRLACDEGSFDYAFSMRAWTFRDPALAHAARHGRVTVLRDAIDTHEVVLDAWRQAHPDEHDHAQPHPHG